MKIRFPIVFATVIGMTLGVSGCAGTDKPLASSPPLHSQDKLRAVDHWDNLADTVAKRVQKTLEDRPDLMAKSLYIQPPNDRPFSVAFYKLLHTRLLTKGMQVAEKPEPCGLVIEYDVQTVRHDSGGSWTPSLAGVGMGLAGLVTGDFGTPSRNEIVLNTRMVHQNRYVMHLSQLAYIDDDEWAMYAGPESGDPQNTSTRKVRIVAR